ncbi:MAG TPA: DEAD/DEAH box helicase family protein [Acidimicrobiales bacterium]|nr:DEAD/DEAH box helicase family protein [Acidimicrobiales bacterium]
MKDVAVDIDLVADITSRLDLREPNREALESIVIELSQHYDVDNRPAPFEAVVDSATGVGKTYILAAAIEYLAAKGTRNFAIVAPGLTILRKTVANFTEGGAKSLTGPMNIQPVVITSEDFDTAAMRAEMDDPDRVKLFIFSVQALTKPTTKVGKRTHKFQEGLGAAFYEHLDALDDLVVFADEHHLYYGEAFSAAIRDLTPHAIVGLTATPHKKTPADAIIFRYPLAAAIADRLVKTPVIVGRKDDRTDSETKLADGLNLLRIKTELAHAYADEKGRSRVNPVMLVVAQTAEEAEEYGEILRSQEFDGGDWADRVLVVHYNAPEEALEALDRVEDLDSPVRVIIAVRMLAEGWDVKNVYVIASMRASVSTILTEQTLGRGLRLPWGSYTDVEMLDTLEVLAHERYEELLKKAGVLSEAFVDQRTRALLRKNAMGQTVSVVETTTVEAPVVQLPASAEGAAAAVAQTRVGGAVVTSVEDRQKEAQKESPTYEQTYLPLDSMPTINVPRLRMTPVESAFSLGDITDLEPFATLGRRIATDPDAELRRVKVSARVVEGFDGIRRTELVTSTAVDRVGAARSLFPLEDLKRSLVEAVLGSPTVPARREERAHAARLVEAFVAGVGERAEELLSAYRDRATARLVRLVTDEQRHFASKPKFDEVVEVVPLGRPRCSRRPVTKDRTGVFRKSLAYNGWSKSMYGVDWFDSEPERAVAVAVDDADDVTCWVRLQTGELPILWTSDGRQYNADLIVVDASGTKWVVEVKRDSDIDSDEVQGKRQAAKRWVNHVNASDRVDAEWRYLLLSETDIKQAKGSWPALAGLGS